MSSSVVTLDLPKVISSIRMSFDKACTARGWTAAPEATARAIALVQEELGLCPNLFHYGFRQCSVLLLWEIYGRSLAVNVYLDGTVRWTIAHEYGLSYEDRDGEGLGRAFVTALRRLRRHRDSTLC